MGISSDERSSEVRYSCVSSGPALLLYAISHGEVGGVICFWRLRGACEKRRDNYQQK